jgi:hypothetical protein
LALARVTPSIDLIDLFLVYYLRIIILRIIPHFMLSFELGII